MLWRDVAGIGMAFTEELPLDGEGLLGQLQRALRVAQGIVVPGDVVEVFGRIRMALDEELPVDGEGLLC